MADNYPEKRREPRRSANGALTLSWEGGPGSPVEGDLVDISQHGFRAAHAFTGLTTGQEVVFEHADAQGRARVMWTRILGASVESGFLVLGKMDASE
jgi:hypothetical protein